jgi:hypothetical protein
VTDGGVHGEADVGEEVLVGAEGEDDWPFFQWPVASVTGSDLIAMFFFGYLVKLLGKTGIPDDRMTGWQDVIEGSHYNDICGWAGGSAVGVCDVNVNVFEVVFDIVELK